MQTQSNVQENNKGFVFVIFFGAGDGTQGLPSGRHSTTTELLSLPQMVRGFSCCSLFGFFSGTGIWTQDFTLARQVLYFLSHSISPNLMVLDA
jgi:hypothetical protein